MTPTTQAISAPSVAIRLAQLRPNPYRHMELYRLDEAKVTRLAQSIQGTSFWDNLLVRPGKDAGTYENVYGHNRLAALKTVMTPEDVVAAQPPPPAIGRCPRGQYPNEWARSR